MSALNFFLVASFLVAGAFSSEEPENARVKKDLLLRSAYVGSAYAAPPAIAAPVISARALHAPVISAAPAIAAPLIPAVHTIPTAYSTSYRVDYPRYYPTGLYPYLY